MAVIHFNVPGSAGGGGPSVWVYKTALALIKRGHKVIYDNPSKSDIAICIIETGKVLRQIDRKKTKTLLRLDGIYAKKYWNGSLGREWRADMTALHNKLMSDIPSVDHVVFQSQWSKNLIDKEIVERDYDFSIISNGVDTNLFIPSQRPNDGFINLFSIGKMRNWYIMESLIGTYQELKQRGHKVKLILAGNMDVECSAVYSKHKADSGIVHLGSFPNNLAPKAFANGDIYIGPRQGSSCDNVISEALASGLPVVIPLFGGNAELISDGKEGIIVSSNEWDYGPGYIKRLADGVEKIIPDLNGYKLRARQYAISNLTIDIMVDKYLKAIGL